MKKYMIILVLPLLLASCGLQRPLVLPQNDKYKHKPDTDTSSTLPIPLPDVTATPPTTTAPTEAIQK